VGSWQTDVSGWQATRWVRPGNRNHGRRGHRQGMGGANALLARQPWQTILSLLRPPQLLARQVAVATAQKHHIANGGPGSKRSPQC